MKVALVSGDNSIKQRVGGKHVHQELLFEGLNELGEVVERVYFPGFSFFTLGATRAASLFVRSFAVKWRVNRMIAFFRGVSFNGFDVVHSHDVVSAYGSDAENLVMTVHGYFAREIFDYSDYLDITRDKQLFEWLLWIERAAVNKSKKIVAVDGRIKEYLISEFGVSNQKIVVLHNAVDDKVFSPVDDDEKIALREKLKIPKKAFVVLLPRRFVPKNGVVYAAEAFSRLKNDNYFFIIAGNGKLKGEILNVLSNNKNFVLLEKLSHEKIVEYYKASDVVLVPSITSTDVEEGTSLSMLEGMACGKVTICTKVGGMKEVIKHMENGILIEQKDAQAIVDAIRYVRENYEKLGYLRNNARIYAVENHGYLNYAKRLREIYSEVVNG